MGVVTINGAGLPVSQFSEDAELLTFPERTDDGAIATSRATLTARARHFSVTASLDSRVAAAALVDTLRAPGFVDLGGVAVDSQTIVCRASDIGDTIEYLGDDVRVSFRLHEALEVEP